MTRFTEFDAQVCVIGQDVTFSTKNRSLGLNLDFRALYYRNGDSH